MMDQSWQRDDCEELKAIAQTFSILEASLRWCNVPEDMLEDIAKEAAPKTHSGAGRAIWTHPGIPCLEARSSLIARAIELGELPQAREDGLPTEEHVAPPRRHVTGGTLRAWLQNRFPDEKPEFLFPKPSTDKADKENVSPRSENSYLAIIGALLEFVKGDVPGIDAHQDFKSEAELISKLSSHYDGYAGVSKRNLEKRFADAKKILSS